MDLSLKVSRPEARQQFVAFGLPEVLPEVQPQQAKGFNFQPLARPEDVKPWWNSAQYTASQC